MILVIIGAGGFGREVLDVVEAINGNVETDDQAVSVLGFLDDGEPDRSLLTSYGLSHLGTVDLLTSMPSEVGYVIGIANPHIKQQIDRRFADTRTSPVLVHPSATMGRTVAVGPGTVIAAHVSLMNHIQLGRHVHINLNSTIGHDAVLEDYVTVSPLVAVSGNVTCEAGVFLGTGAIVNPGLTLGREAVVGSGAVVVRDVRSGTTVVGVPAKAR